MSAVTQKSATYADILTLPEPLIGELIHNTLHTQPRPAPKHIWLASSLGDELGASFSKGRGGPGGWWILDEPECHLDGQVVVPDLAGWRREHLPKLPSTAYFETVPDWACEILSPSTARKDRALKLPLYAQLGVRHCWLIDPELRTLEAYANHAGLWTLLGVWSETDAVQIPPFDAITLVLPNLWAE